MDSFCEKMAKFKNDISKKTIHKMTKFEYTLYILCIVKFSDIICYHYPYNYGSFAVFKPNWLNPLSYIYIIISLLIGSFVAIIDTAVNIIDNFKKGFSIYI